MQGHISTRHDINTPRGVSGIPSLFIRFGLSQSKWIWPLSAFSFFVPLTHSVHSFTYTLQVYVDRRGSFPAPWYASPGAEMIQKLFVSFDVPVQFTHQKTKAQYMQFRHPQPPRAHHNTLFDNDQLPQLHILPRIARTIPKRHILQPKSLLPLLPFRSLPPRRLPVKPARRVSRL